MYQSNEQRVHIKKLMGRTGVNVVNALEAVWTNRTRSILTMLTNIIGVAAVVAVFTVRQGAGIYFTNQLLSAGTNSITIDPGITHTGGFSRGMAGEPLTFQDFQAVGKLLDVTASSPILYAGGGQAVYGEQSWQTNGRGVSADYQNIASWNMAEGLWFSDADNARARPVVFIGDTVYQNLFVPLNIDPIGKIITYQGQPFKIMGGIGP